MAPVGNVATFQGTPNTSGINLPAALFEMPKLTAAVSLIPYQAFNSVPDFLTVVPHNSTQPTSSGAFLPANLLMSCNLSFLTPQQLAYYAFHMQSQQQQNQQSPSPAINNPLLNPMNVGMVAAQFMPAFVQQPFLGTIPLAATLPMIQTNQLFQQQMASKHEQASPAASVLQSSAFFNTPTTSDFSPVNPVTSTINTSSSFIDVSQQHGVATTNAFKQASNLSSSVAVKPETAMHWKDQPLLQFTTEQQQQQQQQISRPTLRSDSPEFNELNEYNMPPMLQPELPCFNEFADLDDFSVPPPLVSNRQFMLDDEYGPPQLEPQVPILSMSEENSCDRQLAPTTSSTSSSSDNLSPTKASGNNKDRHFFATQPVLAAALKDFAQFPTLSTQQPEANQPSTESTSLQSSRKRNRSKSSDSLSDVMSKMPKLVPMVEQEPPVKELATSLRETAEEAENTTPPALDTATVNPVDQSWKADELSKPTENTKTSLEEVVTNADKEVEAIETDLPVLTESHVSNVSSSSGVSSADSSLSTEEPIIIRFKRPVEAKASKAQSEKMMCNTKIEFPTPSPLTPIQNTKLRPRQQKPQLKKPTRKVTAKSRPKSCKPKQQCSPVEYKRVTIQSDWVPVDEGRYVYFRLGHETHPQPRRCYNAIQHSRERDEIIRVRDCIKVRSSEGLENIGKVLRLFLDESNGAICVQVLWYYTQAQASKDIVLHEKELLASKHFDTINADAIEEHAYVLTFGEYCRFVAETRLDELPPHQRPLESDEIISRGDHSYRRRIRLPHEDSPIDLVFWCSRVYSVRTRKICVTATTFRRTYRSGRRR